MRKLIYLVAAVVPLVATGYAVAHGIEGAKSADPVTASFNATAAKTSSWTCTTSDGRTITVTNGRYTGVASGGLAGPITVSARSVIDGKTNLGAVDGRMTIDVPGRNVAANFSAVYDGGTIAGLAVGRSHGPGSRLLANFSSGFSAASGFTSGMIGKGAAGGSAVELTPGACKPARQTSQHSEAHGTISVNGNQVTVAGLTCTIPPQLTDAVSKFKPGDVVEIRCALQANVNTLTRIHGHH
jgi:hypothetical protein